MKSVSLERKKAIAFSNGEDWIFIETGRGTWTRLWRAKKGDEDVYSRIFLGSC